MHGQFTVQLSLPETLSLRDPVLFIKTIQSRNEYKLYVYNITIYKLTSERLGITRHPLLVL